MDNKRDETPSGCDLASLGQSHAENTANSHFIFEHDFTRSPHAQTNSEFLDPNKFSVESTSQLTYNTFDSNFIPYSEHLPTSIVSESLDGLYDTNHFETGLTDYDANIMQSSVQLSDLYPVGIPHGINQGFLSHSEDHENLFSVPNSMFQNTEIEQIGDEGEGRNNEYSDDQSQNACRLQQIQTDSDSSSDEVPYTISKHFGSEFNDNASDDDSDGSNFEGSRNSLSSETMAANIALYHQHQESEWNEKMRALNPLSTIDWTNYDVDGKNKQVKQWLIKSWSTRVADTTNWNFMAQSDLPIAFKWDSSFHNGEIVWVQIRDQDDQIEDSELYWPAQVIHGWKTSINLPKTLNSHVPPSWFEIFNDILRIDEKSILKSAKNSQSPSPSSSPNSTNSALSNTFKYLLRLLPQADLTLLKAEVVARILEDISLPSEENTLPSSSFIIRDHYELIPFVFNVSPNPGNNLQYNKAILQAVDIVSGWAPFDEDIKIAEVNVEKSAIESKLRQFNKSQQDTTPSSLLGDSPRKRKISDNFPTESLGNEDKTHDLKKSKKSVDDDSMKSTVEGILPEIHALLVGYHGSNLGLESILSAAAHDASQDFNELPLRRLRFGSEIINIGDLVRLIPRKRPTIDKQSPKSKNKLDVEKSTNNETSKSEDEAAVPEIPFTIMNSKFDDSDSDSSDEYVDSEHSIIYFKHTVDEYLEITSMEFSDNNRYFVENSGPITRRLRKTGPYGKSFVKVTGKMYYRVEKEGNNFLWQSDGQHVTVDLIGDIAGRYYPLFPFYSEYKILLERKSIPVFGSHEESAGLIIDLLTYDGYSDYLEGIMNLSGSRVPVVGEATFNLTDFNSVNQLRADRRDEMISSYLKEIDSETHFN
ncbi:hypothetical protein HK096_010218 [Nowakowskiella sp. JEL0078]|nr:hypothetical protein HK096_010218 [Nowakowskiella sp. JEL0078]